MKKLAVIGCGLRSDCYLSEMQAFLGKEWVLAALADPNPVAIEVYQKNFGSPSVEVFADGPSLLEAMKGKIDGVIIGSPNVEHLASLLPALEQGLTILLEKPVATTLEDCVKMWHGYREAGEPPLAVGFVLRYTPFYKKIKEFIASGKLGQVLSIQATELLGPALSANYMRGWRRFTRASGPLILEKCSHDFDILNWLTDSRAVRVSSFGSRTRFVPNPEASMHCKDCALENECRYAAGRIAPYLMNWGRAKALGPLIAVDNDLCVFNSEKDIWDHQVANIEYANGILASFTVCMDAPKTTRTILVNGTQAQLFGDISEDSLEIRHHVDGRSEKASVEMVPIKHDGSAHHGGDSVISTHFRSMLANGEIKPLAGLREGIEAAMLALAAERAARTSTVVEGEQIFGGLSF